MFITAGPIINLCAGGEGVSAVARTVCVFYYCRTYYKAVRVGEEEESELV